MSSNRMSVTQPRDSVTGQVNVCELDGSGNQMSINRMPRLRDRHLVTRHLWFGYRTIQLSDMFRAFGYRTRPVTECLLYLEVLKYLTTIQIEDILIPDPKSPVFRRTNSSYHSNSFSRFDCFCLQFEGDSLSQLLQVGAVFNHWDMDCLFALTWTL